VHYEAPPPQAVPGEMHLFFQWMAENDASDQYVKASLAHLWFESIHPFDDGNGRIGRAIVDNMLAKAENSKMRYYSLSTQLLKDRKDYYKELELASGYDGDIDRWINWFIRCLLRAVEASNEKVNRVKEKTLFYDRIRNMSLNERQNKMVGTLLDDFKGKLTTAKWAKMCKCSHDTALRDISNLIEKGILQKSSGGGRSTAYELIEGIMRHPDF